MNYKTHFLHNHPMMERDLNIPRDHVIVDRKDWEQFQKDKTIEINKPIAPEIEVLGEGEIKEKPRRGFLGIEFWWKHSDMMNRYFLSEFRILLLRKY